MNVEGWGERREERHFFRWFYDEASGKERLDGPERFGGEFFLTERILDTKLNKDWFVAYQRDLVTCWVGATNRTLPHPNFNNIRYIGKAEIDHRVVNHWAERSADGRDVHQIFNRADNGELKRIDREDPRKGTVTFHFHEYDAGVQDPALFVLPDAINKICNNIPSQL